MYIYYTLVFSDTPDEHQSHASNDTVGVAITADTNCCANCVETSCPHQWGPDLPFFGIPAMRGAAGWLAFILIKADDVDTHPGPTTTHKQYLP